LKRNTVALWVHVAISIAIMASGGVLFWLEILRYLSGGEMNHDRAAFWFITLSFGAALLVHKYYGYEPPLYRVANIKTAPGKRDSAFIAIGLFVTLACFGTTMILWHKDHVLGEALDVWVVVSWVALGAIGLILMLVGLSFSKTPSLFPGDDGVSEQNSRRRYLRIGLWMKIAGLIAAITLIASAVIMFDAKDSSFGVIVSISIALWLSLTLTGIVLGRGKQTSFKSILKFRLHATEKEP